MNPIVAGSLIGTAGGLISNWYNQRQADKERARQEEFAKMGVQWRVQDAKAAGIHPLAALGMSGASSTPITVQDSVGPAVSAMGQNLTRAAELQQTPEQKTEAKLRNALLFAEIAHKQAQTDAILDSVGDNTPRLSGGMPSAIPEKDQFPIPGQNANAQGMIQLKPSEVTSSQLKDRGVEAGLTPMMKEFIVEGKNGEPMLTATLPEPELLESISELDLTTKMALFAYNSKKYGPQWKWKIAKMLGVPYGKEMYERKQKQRERILLPPRQSYLRG